MLRVRVARTTITPPEGMSMLGYAGREGVAQGKDGELYATALVLEDERTRVGILRCDRAFVQEPLASVLRRQIGVRLGVPPRHVLLNASHTHCGPTLQDFHYDDDPAQQRMREAYSAWLCKEIPEVGGRAVDRLCRARLGTATGEARIGVNRREPQPDGSVILGGNPMGPVDKEVRVIRIDDLEGRPVAVVFAHGCRPVTMGPKCLRWSADYVGSARDLVEGILGCLSLLLQANGGYINPVTGIGSGEDDWDAKNRIGLTLGGEVLKVHSSIYTNSVRAPRTFFGTLAKASIYARVKLEREPEYVLAVRESTLGLPIQELPGFETAREILERCEAEVTRLTAEKSSEAALNVARRWRHWARALFDVVANGGRPLLLGSVQALSESARFRLLRFRERPFPVSASRLSGVHRCETRFLSALATGVCATFPHGMRFRRMDGRFKNAITFRICCFRHTRHRPHWFQRQGKWWWRRRWN
jgi:hypothetical protein